MKRHEDAGIGLPPYSRPACSLLFLYYALLHITHSIAKVTHEAGKFVHESRGTFFALEGAEKQFTLIQGLPWEGGDSIDDYC